MRYRLRLTLDALVQLALAPVALLLLVVVLVGTALTAVWVGFGVLAVAVPALRLVANVHRHIADRTLGLTTTAPYLPVPRRWDDAVFTVARDPMTYRDLLWALWASTLGLLFALSCLLQLALVVTLPLWWWGIGRQQRLRATWERWLLTSGGTAALERRVRMLTASRATIVDRQSSDLRRIERDLHDGAQARLVALTMTLGMTQQSLADDPVRSAQLLGDARELASGALEDLRAVVRGINPPVLADRGLVGAIEALAVDLPLPVQLVMETPGDLAVPVESALFFAIAECLTNVVRHADASNAWVHIDHIGSTLRVEVGDDGLGGADPEAGSGLRGLAARLVPFDGTMRIVSPPGGPTVVTLEVPCA